jgi:hypothetical protein
MRILKGLTTATLTTLAVAFGATAADAKGLNTGLCHSAPARVSIPGNFAVDACFDGSHLVLKNTTTLVLDAFPSGSLGTPTVQEGDQSIGASATRAYTAGDSHIFLPGDTLTFPVSSGSGSVQLRIAPGFDNRFYFFATSIDQWMPFKSTAVVDAVTGFVDELNSDFSQYATCMSSNGWLGQIGCKALLARNVTYAAGRFSVKSAIAFGPATIGLIVSAATWSKWVYDDVGNLGAVLERENSYLLNVAATSPSSPTSSTSSSSSPPPASAPTHTSSPSASLPAGEFAVQNATGGIYWRSAPTWSSADAVSGNGFYPGTVIRISCYQPGAGNVPGSADSMWEQASWVSGPGRGSGWVNEHFINDASPLNTPSPGIGPCPSTSAPSPSPSPSPSPPATTTTAAAAPSQTPTTPAPTPTTQAPIQTTTTASSNPTSTTWAETVGGPSHTWTDPSDAGGNEGPTIATGQTVQIACVLQGFQVADGDTWWYRIASSPWNGAFYVSADAFYNNGETSGSLIGTPLVDPAVAGC